MVWVAAMIPVAGLLGVTALTLNLQRRLVTVELVNVAVYTSGNLLLLGLVGTLASAWIRLVVVLIGPAWTYAIIRRHSGYRLSFRGVPPAAFSAGCAAVAAAALLPVHPAVAAGAGVLAYAVSLRLSKRPIRP
jgi:hypothetical protein